MKIQVDGRFRYWFVFSFLAICASASTAMAGPKTLFEKIAQKDISKTVSSSDSGTKQTKEKEKEQYLRLRRDERERPIALDVAVVRFEPKKRGKNSPMVDLFGAVHMAEPEYYAKLNKRFAGYDAVLYELVAPEGTRPKQGAKGNSGNPLSAIQTGLTQLLNLQFQLEGIDYQSSNMVHADMSPEEFRQSMRDRGESIWTMFIRMLGYSLTQQGKASSGTSDVELLMALLNKNRTLALKRAMAKQFQDLGGVILALDGPKDSTLISHRNAKALDVLRRELNDGKHRIAIFYGAGHMPDMAKRLIKDFGYEPTDKQWLKAWDMSQPETKKPTNQPLTGIRKHQ